ncbi:unnamed protein product [Linum trigynum]|uniref:RRM domain-containing protein n=1 Tax=Linum trigynum TaxID=586398 RepID=A0AAV2DSC5_9ROSI
MDYDYSQHERDFDQGNVLAFNVDEEEHDYYEDFEEIPQQQQQQEQQPQQQGRRDKRQEEEAGAGNGGRTINHSHQSSSSSAPGKLFVGGLSWDTTEETFTNYFSKFGEITDAVIMLDRLSGRPRGFGFVTFSDPVVADRVLERDHTVDGRSVEVKKTVPREDMDFKGMRVKKIFVGGLPPSLTEDELKEYFSFYGGITEYQIMLDHKTGRSRGFGFVTFDSEDSVERIFSEGRNHELGGKEVEIKKAEPRRFGGGDYGSAPKSYGGGFNSEAIGYGSVHGSGGRYSGKMGRGAYAGGGAAAGGYGGYSDFNGYGAGYGAGYAGGAAGFYGAYGGYGYGFGLNNFMMYGNGMYGGGGGSAFPYGAAAGYGVGKGFERTDDGGRGHGSSGGSSGYGSGKAYGGSGGGSTGAGRHHPYRK